MSKILFFLLPHARMRADQRGISIEMIKIAILKGKVLFRQGLRYFICVEKKMSKIIAPSKIDKYKNIVVIMNQKNEVVTCYKNKNAISNIRRKNKWKFRYR